MHNLFNVDAVLHDWLALGIAVVTAIYAFITRRDDRAAAQIVDIDGRIIHLETGMVTLKTKVDDMPSREDYHALGRQIDGLSGRIEVLVERIKPLASTMDRVQDFLAQPIQMVQQVQPADQPKPQLQSRPSRRGAP